MTQGDVRKALLAFSVPSLIGNLLHQVYSLTDSIVVGRILGMEALAAVGCTMPLILLLAALMIGTNIGVGVLLSQAFGAHDMERMRRGFLNSLYVGLGISAVLAVIGAPLSQPVLKLMGTPEETLRNATAYLRINFLTSFCPMLYYLFSCAFRGMGDSRTDLYCLIVSVAMNVVLDILFVAAFHWGVAGSAWATAIAQLSSSVFAAILLFKKYPVMRPGPGDMKPDRKLISTIGRLSVPIAAQSAFNNIGNLVAQGAVNSFGAVAMAAYTAAGRVGAFALMPLETLGNTLSIYTGQNYGAGKTARMEEGRRVTLRLQFGLSTVLGVLLLLCVLRLERMHVHDEEYLVQRRPCGRSARAGPRHQDANAERSPRGILGHGQEPVHALSVESREVHAVAVGGLRGALWIQGHLGIKRNFPFKARLLRSPVGVEVGGARLALANLPHVVANAPDGGGLVRRHGEAHEPLLDHLALYGKGVASGEVRLA